MRTCFGRSAWFSLVMRRRSWEPGGARQQGSRPPPLRPRTCGRGRLKIEIAVAVARRTATAPRFEAVAVPYGVIEEEGFRAALDCDLLFSCVDRPWPRSALNFIAYAHLVPVIDGGIRLVQAAGGGVRRGDVRAHAVGPTRACLECLGQFTPEDAALERDGYLDDSTYIARLRDGHHLKARQNVFAFSLVAAALEAMHMLSMLVAPVGLEFPAQAYHFVPGCLDDIAVGCKSGCLYQAMIGSGDHAPISVTRRHELAELMRNR